MSSRSYVVETRGQAAAIFGGRNLLSHDLVLSLASKGIQATLISNLEQIESLRNDFDLDYLIVFADSYGGEFNQKLLEYVTSGESRIYALEPLGLKKNSLGTLSIFKRIIYSDYLSENEIGSDLLSGWFKNLKNRDPMVIPGDGLEEISLLGKDDLTELLGNAILRPSREGEIIHLGNPDSISVLNLAYLIRSSLPRKIDLKFSEEGEGTIPHQDFDEYRSTLNSLSYHLIGSPESLLKSYLKTIEQKPRLSSEFVEVVEDKVNSPIIVEKPKSLEAIIPPPLKRPPALSPLDRVLPAKQLEKPLAPLKKLTPLRSPTAVFVPLEPHKKTRNPFRLRLKFPERPKRVRKNIFRSIVGRGLIIAFALYLGTLAFSATISGLFLKRATSSLLQGEIPTPNSLNTFTTTYLQANWLVFTSIPGVSNKQSVIDITLLLDAYRQALSTFDSALTLGTTSQELVHYVFGSGSGDPAQLVSLARLESEELYQKLSLLDGALPETPPSIIPSRYLDNYKEGKNELTKLKRGVTTTKALLASAPDFIGLGGRRKYGVLFQNNMELRATGGFIGSFAVLSFENGKLYDMPIYDVYDADGQLKGHVEPPKPIKDVLGEANWYLRDSNFDPDFPTSARRAEWFIKKSLNLDLDGTIGVNVNTLSSLLRATGPLEVPDYNETITADNLYERSQIHAEVNFFPGSTQKKEFLSTVANSLFAKIPSLGGGDGLKLAGALSESVTEKNTLISVLSPATSHIFETLGWTGELSDLPCPTTGNCHKDFAMVVDSNFGVNKANYFVRRNITQTITFDKNLTVNHTLRLSYQNTSTSTAWPAGVYKNYSRLYLPVGANISKISLGERVLDAKDYSQGVEHDKAVIGYLVSIPINSTLDVVVEYTTPQLPQENELLYSWYWQKQSGTSSLDPVTVYLNYPLFLRPVVISPSADLFPQQLKINFQNDTDHRLTVKFNK